MTVNLEAELSREFPSNGGQATVEAVIRPAVKDRHAMRKVALVVDTSTSMSGQKVEYARKGVLQVLNELNQDDQVSLISFDTQTDVLVSMVRWGDADQESIRKMVTGSDSEEYDGELVASGGTDIYSAIDRTWSEFDANANPSAVSRDLILLSDGKDSRDLSDFEDIATEMNGDGITISAGGIGRRYKEELLLALTENSGGKPYHLQDPDDIESFFERRVRAAGDTVASSPSLHIDIEEQFVLNEDENAYFTSPTNLSNSIITDDESAVIELPRLHAGEVQELTFEVLGMPQQTGLDYTVAELAVQGNGETLATTTVQGRYADSPEKKEYIEKDRERAKITTEMKDDSVDKERVREKIEALEKDRKWRKTAEELRKRLVESEGQGGTIRVSKAKYNPDE